MAYRVIAGYATVQTKLDKGRAYIDIPRGAELPSDVPAEEVEWLLRSGQIEESKKTSKDNLDGLSKDDLVKVAEDEGVEVDKRWGAEKIAAAIRENR